MNIEAKKLSIIQQILSIDNANIIQELEVKIAQLVHKTQNEPQTLSTLSEEVSSLILKINEGLPKKIQKQYSDLSLKSVQGTLTVKEQEALLILIPKVEKKTVERLKYLIELSQLWDMSVDEVMEKLEIHPPNVIHV